MVRKCACDELSRAARLGWADEKSDFFSILLGIFN